MHKIILAFIFVLSLSAAGFADTTNQTESYTIMTYYPSPYGVYKNLRLYSSTEPTAAADRQTGTMFYNSSSNDIYVSDGSRFYRIGGWVVSGTNFYPLDSNLNVAIGYTNPGTYKLYVAGTMYVSSTVTSGGGFVTSDARLKKNTEELSGVLERLKSVNGITFDWRTDEFPERGLSTGRQIGLIAQEVEKGFPELVNTDAEGYKNLAYDRFSAVLLEAIKEQQKEIDVLRQEVNNLKTKLDKK